MSKIFAVALSVVLAVAGFGRLSDVQAASRGGGGHSGGHASFGSAVAVGGHGGSGIVAGFGGAHFVSAPTLYKTTRSVPIGVRYGAYLEGRPRVIRFHHRGEDRGRRFGRGYGYGYGFASGYDSVDALYPVPPVSYVSSYDRCAWLRDSYQHTGLRKWRQRYIACLNGDGD